MTNKTAEVLNATSRAKPRPDTSVRDAYAFCRDVAHKHGANFSVGFRFLPQRKRNAVYAAYAWCRWADDIADEPGSEIPERLDQWERELEACYNGTPSHVITTALTDALAWFEIPQSAFVALLDGCRQDLVKQRYETFEELLHYCDLVASSISDISLSIFGYRSGKSPALGRNLSTALQLTNVTRDIGDDLQRDRIYLPLEEMKRFGVSESDLFERRKSEGMLALINFQIRRASGYFEAANPLLKELSFDARFPTQLMGAVYATVLSRLRKDPFLALGDRISLSRSAKLRVVARSLVRSEFI